MSYPTYSYPPFPLDYSFIPTMPDMFVPDAGYQGPTPPLLPPANSSGGPGPPMANPYIGQQGCSGPGCGDALQQAVRGSSDSYTGKSGDCTPAGDCQGCGQDWLAAAECRLRQLLDIGLWNVGLLVLAGFGLYLALRPEINQAARTAGKTAIRAAAAA